MAPWLSRAEREAKARSSLSATLASEGRRSRSSSGNFCGASSPTLKRRRLSDQVESIDASLPKPKRRRLSDQVESAGASSPRPQGQRPQDVVEGTGASSPAAKRPRLLDEVESIEDLVGPSSETREAHLRRHAGGRRTCPRCRYYTHGAAWTATYGSCLAPTGPRRRIVWLAERPARQGGAWALG